jgi:hypothetical protein
VAETRYLIRTDSHFCIRKFSGRISGGMSGRKYGGKNTKGRKEGRRSVEGGKGGGEMRAFRSKFRRDKMRTDLSFSSKFVTH